MAIGRHVQLFEQSMQTYKFNFFITKQKLNNFKVLHVLDFDKGSKRSSGLKKKSNFGMPEKKSTFSNSFPKNTQSHEYADTKNNLHFTINSFHLPGCFRSKA
ncbi:MAG: hypothetical protein Q8908_15425 [Bacteroidota bacterium]|nr:hypothetical protein [Bacteroidota bacterium]